MVLEKFGGIWRYYRLVQLSRTTIIILIVYEHTGYYVGILVGAEPIIHISSAFLRCDLNLISAWVAVEIGIGLEYVVWRLIWLSRLVPI
jgi:hypothetical protein